MTTTTYTDREIALTKQLAAMTATATEYQQAADKMAMEHKVERDALTQQVNELEQDRDEWKDSTISANANAANEEKRRRAMQEERDTLRQQLAEALITYRHKDGTTRFEQYAKDRVPVWAVDVQPVAQQAEQVKALAKKQRVREQIRQRRANKGMKP